jgi:hypothetical protein
MFTVQIFATATGSAPSSRKRDTQHGEVTSRTCGFGPRGFEPFPCPFRAEVLAVGTKSGVA